MINYFLYRFGQWLALTLPIKFSYKLAEFFSDLHSLFSGKDRRDVAYNLKTIFPFKSDKEISVIRRQMKRNFGKYLVDFFRFSLIDEEYIKKHVRIENIGYVQEALSLGKGVVALTAHLGNWELAGVATALSGHDLWAVALEHKNKKVNDFFNAQREGKRVHVIPFSSAVRQCLAVLRQKRVLALVGDRDFHGKGIMVDFFGKPAKLPLGPAVFSLKTGSPVVPGFLIREGSADNFRLVFEKPIILSPSGDTEKDIKELVLAGKVVLEKYIRMYPDQWFTFRRFWV
jgi:KDO2-lipid IV(A) lauroyltransferase